MEFFPSLTVHREEKRGGQQAQRFELPSLNDLDHQFEAASFGLLSQDLNNERNRGECK